MEIVNRYTKDEVDQFPKMLGELISELEVEPDDVLGGVFHELELHNKYQGQFFTPMSICRVMAKMTIDTTEHQAIIAERGFLTASEP